MPNNTTTGWLDALNWGTTENGDPGIAETGNTLGSDRLDLAVPADQYHIGGLQISRIKNLALAMSQYFKGGTRLQILTQTASPFGAGEVGFWGDNATTPNARYSDGATANYVAAGAVTSKGDMLIFNGTNWVVLPVGANNKVLTADSTQPAGVKWA